MMKQLLTLLFFTPVLLLGQQSFYLPGYIVNNIIGSEECEQCLSEVQKAKLENLKNFLTALNIADDSGLEIMFATNDLGDDPDVRLNSLIFRYGSFPSEEEKNDAIEKIKPYVQKLFESNKSKKKGIFRHMESLFILSSMYTLYFGNKNSHATKEMVINYTDQEKWKGEYAINKLKSINSRFGIDLCAAVKEAAADDVIDMVIEH
jgi:hypothetical protein